MGVWGGGGGGVIYVSVANITSPKRKVLYCRGQCMARLKPQDSFGEVDPKTNLDLQKVQEIIRKYHQAFLQLICMTCCNAILPRGKFSLCT